MNIYKLIIAFLIGFALYLLVNRVFMEGLEGSPAPITCDNQPQTPCPPNIQTGCLDTDIGVWSCEVSEPDCIGTNQIWCEKYPGQSPNPSQSLTEEEKQLKGIIENAIQGDVFKYWDEVMYVEGTKLQFNFDTSESYITFKNLLDRNTKESFISLNGKPTFVHFNLRSEINIYEADDLDISYIAKIVNCFKEDINGISYTYSTNEEFKDWESNCRIVGNLSDLPNLPQLQYLNLYNTGVEGNLSKLPSLPQLQYLNLSAMGVKGNLSDLPSLPQLKYLNLYYMGVEGNLSDLPSLSELQYLNLGDTGVEGNLSKLPSLPQLQYLNLSAMGVEGNLSDLHGLKYLEELYLCPEADIRGDVTDTPAIYDAYVKGNTDLEDCDNVTEIIDIDCEFSKYNCKCGDSPVTCDN